MARKAGRQYTHVLDIMKANGGRVELTDPALVALLGDTMYRVAGYVYDIRKYAKLEVRAVRSGRKVVAYELVAAIPATTETTAEVSASASPATV